MRQRIPDTILNVPIERFLMHYQILALKCFYHVTWMDRSLEGFLSDLWGMSIVLPTYMNPSEPSISKISTYFMHFLVLCQNQLGMSYALVYFYALAASFKNRNFQRFMDLILIKKVLTKLRSGTNTRLQFLMSVALVAAVWYCIPIETLFFLVLFYEIFNTSINEELILYKICYLQSAFLLLVHYQDDIDLDWFWQPLEYLRRPFLPQESNNTVLRM